ncbi:MAG: DUF488 domain-containing protein [Nitrososphaerota archaeon]
MYDIRVKRVYEAADEDDGVRILVDRLWPRGLKKNTAKIDLWMRDIAPSTGLRKWFGHDPSKWVEFRRRYWEELAGREELVQQLLQMARKSRITLLYSASDRERNNAVALYEFLMRRASP